MLGGLDITLAQINPIVGDLKGNADKMLDIWGRTDGDLVIFPELSLIGYPPEDLVLKPDLLNRADDMLQYLCEQSTAFKSGAIIGSTWHKNGCTYNAAYLIENGEIKATQAKQNLPNYGVFDEMRIFSAGPLPEPITFRGSKIGLLICEDMWPKDSAALHLKEQGAEILVTINASPFVEHKHETRLKLAQHRVQETGLPLIYVNQVGGQDELAFDGGSFVMNEKGECTLQMSFFEEDVRRYDSALTTLIPPLDQSRMVYDALRTGVKDYVGKNGFPGVLIGLSGGVDSALAAAIAVDALGADKVHCIMMPSPYTSQDSLDDAALLAENLGCTYDIIPIESAMNALPETMPGLSPLAHENLQSRIRGLILMAQSNTNGKMLLTTGNKSEMAVGYATLYGDMCGGYNPLKDIYKTKVYALCEWRNSQGALIPQRILTKAPSAELRENQTDQDSLPPYDVLDDILKMLIEEDMGVEEICSKGHDEATVKKVQHLLYRAEYKRYQSPPGTVITERAFGRDRRYPLTNKF